MNVYIVTRSHTRYEMFDDGIMRAVNHNTYLIKAQEDDRDLCYYGYDGIMNHIKFKKWNLVDGPLV